jgi:hypothetical protein
MLDYHDLEPRGVEAMIIFKQLEHPDGLEGN